MMRVRAMSKSIIISLVLVSLIISGCANQPQGETQDLSPSDTPPELTDTSASENDIASLDIELSELEYMIEDSEFSEEDFLELNEGTFE